MDKLRVLLNKTISIDPSDISLDINARDTDTQLLNVIEQELLISEQSLEL
jgi:hypothetical protein